MKIYKQEILDGLRDRLKDPAYSSLAFTLPIEPFQPNINSKQTKSCASLFNTEATNLNQYDLYYLRTILVTTGINKNDDIFLPEEVWSSRTTPEDKPFNLSHNPGKIIGHITGNWAVDDDYSELSDDLSIDELPNKFHLLTSAVIYRYINAIDKDTKVDLQAEAEELINGIENNEWRVSMECLFPMFDYGIYNANGEIEEIIPRNKDTAYHTKYLRIYQGSGEYKGKKIGRVLRNIVFSGKGLVKKPANPESIILNSSANIGVNIDRNVVTDITENTMAENVDKQEDLQKQIADLQVQLESHKTQISSLEASLKDANDKVTTLSTANDNLTQKNQEIETNLTAKAEELYKIQADILRSNRITTLVDKGVEKTQAETIVDKYVALNDEQFSGIVEMQSEIAAAKKDKAGCGKMLPEDKKEDMEDECAKKKSACAEENEDVEGEKNADASKLEDAKETKTDIDAAIASEDKKLQIRSALASFFDNCLGNNTDTDK